MKGMVNSVSVNEMSGATSTAAGVSGLVPAPGAGDQDKVLKGDGTWGTAPDSANIRYNDTDHTVEAYVNGSWEVLFTNVYAGTYKGSVVYYDYSQGHLTSVKVVYLTVKIQNGYMIYYNKDYSEYVNNGGTFRSGYGYADGSVLVARDSNGNFDITPAMGAKYKNVDTSSNNDDTSIINTVLPLDISSMSTGTGDAVYRGIGGNHIIFITLNQ